MTATLLLIRHAAHAELGRVLSGRSPCQGLTDAGEWQAGMLARRLGGVRLAAIYSSPITRARRTAEVLGERLQAPVEIAAALTEVEFGGWTGRAYAALAEEPGWARWNTHRATARAGGGDGTDSGETMAAAQARIVAFLRERAAAHAGAAIAIVSHCDMIRAAIADVLGLSLDRLLAFDIDPASVSRVVMGQWGGRVLSMNEGPADEGAGHDGAMA